MRDKDQAAVDICFLPWLRLIKPIEMGGVAFLPAEELINRLEDKAIANQVRRTLSCYVDETGKPLSNNTVCQLKNRRRAERMSEKDVTIIRQAVDALYFASVFAQSQGGILDPNYSSHYSIQHFELVHHKAPVGSDTFRVVRPNAIIVNCSYDSFKFRRPLGVGIRPLVLDYRFAEELCSLFDRGSRELRERVLRALEWVRFAHDDTGSVTEPSKVVMMATAFEILLQISNRSQKKKKLMDALDKLCRARSSVARRRKVDRPRRGTGKVRKRKTFSLMAWWMRDFYELRNAVVHGDEIHDRRLLHTTACGKIPHLRVADVVMGECVWRGLFEAGLVGDDCRRRAAYLKSHHTYYSTWQEEKIARDWAPLYAKTDQVLEKLGWWELGRGQG